jgi:hypothetical protein
LDPDHERLEGQAFRFSGVTECADQDSVLIFPWAESAMEKAIAKGFARRAR